MKDYKLKLRNLHASHWVGRLIVKFLFFLFGGPRIDIQGSQARSVTNAQRVLQEDTCGHMHGNGAVLRATFMQLLVAARERDGCYWSSAHHDHDHERCLVTTDISICCAL
jgi:hypothetical protein